MFRPRGSKFTLSEIAEKLGCGFAGNGDLLLGGVAPLDEAGPDELSFFTNPAYSDALKCSKAGAVIMKEGSEAGGRNAVFSDNPYLAFAEALKIFYSVNRKIEGISAKADIGKNCGIHATASIAPFVSIGDNCLVGEGTVIMPGCVVGEGSAIGGNCWLYPNVTVYHGVRIGNGVIIHSGSVIGSDGFGFAQGADGHRKIPQVGGVVIEDDVEIGANVCIDRGALKDTVIGRNTKIDNLVQIAHNVRIGESSLLVAQSGISGSTVLGRQVVVAGQSGAVGHISLGDGTRVGAKSAVTKSTEAGAFVTGFPAIDHREWLRIQALIARLPEMAARIKELEKKVSDLQEE